jgi:tight adherence protein C
MSEASPLLLAVMLLGAGALAFLGMQGLFDIRAALRNGEFDRLASVRYWPATRGFCGLCAALPVYLATRSLGPAAFAAAMCAAGLGYAVAPQFRDEARRRAEQSVLDELALHLDLIALVMESGGSLTAAITACAERAPEGVLRRAWVRALLEIHSGAPVHDVLRDLDLRLGVRAFSTLVTMLRGADRAGLDAAAVLRERARQAAASRFARAERLARAAPLKLWATMALCLVPCTPLVLAFPLARLLAQIFDR